MTAAMLLWHRRLPVVEKYPLPPRDITGEFLDKSGISVGTEPLSTATLVAHFAYGGAVGGVYVLIPPNALQRPLSTGLMMTRSGRCPPRETALVPRQLSETVK